MLKSLDSPKREGRRLSAMKRGGEESEGARERREKSGRPQNGAGWRSKQVRGKQEAKRGKREDFRCGDTIRMFQVVGRSCGWNESEKGRGGARPKEMECLSRGKGGRRF